MFISIHNSLLNYQQLPSKQQIYYQNSIFKIYIQSENYTNANYTDYFRRKSTEFINVGEKKQR